MEFFVAISLVGNPFQLAEVSIHEWRMISKLGARGGLGVFGKRKIFLDSARFLHNMDLLATGWIRNYEAFLFLEA